MNFDFLADFFNIGKFDYINLLSKLALDLISIYILIKLIYFKSRKNRSYLFMFGIFNIVIYLVCYMLSNLELSLGFSFGIFAIFSILRYRTACVPIKEMTYLFISIGIGMINSMANETISPLELIFTNAAIVTATFLLEKFGIGKESVKYIVYEKIELVKPNNYQLLIEDLKERTGLDITRAEIGEINFLRDVAQVRVYFKTNNGNDFVSEDGNDDDE